MAVEFELKTTRETPPGNFRITVPSTNLRIEHYDWEAFSRAYRDHHIANGLPLSEDWELEVQDTMCKENMAQWNQHCKRAGKHRPKGGPSFGAVMTFLNMLRAWATMALKGEAAYVDQETANSRALTCTTCPYNSRKIGWGCGGCMSQYTSLVNIIIGKRNTPYDGELGGCGVCSCSLRAAVHVPLQPQWDALSQEKKEEFKAIPWCWKHGE